jgi:glucose/arabinose dehydrogenase
MSRACTATTAAILLLLLTACTAVPEGSSPAEQPSPPAPAASPATTEASGSPAPSDAASDATGQMSQPELGEVQLSLDPVVELDAPTAMADRPGDEAALYVAERGGRVVRVVDGAVDDAPVLDISDQTTSDGERGLLGIDFSDDGSRLYVSYTDRNGDSRLDEYRMTANRADAGSQRMLFEVAQPYSNHNGGNVVTGPDGLLYYGLGDGGSAGDPHNNGQDRSTLLGDLLRIDPRPGDDAPYRVPDDNPFVGDGETRPEIWIYGLRNPWRFSFDRETDDLWIADVGQGELEEIDRLPFDQAGGTNLGWRVFEGTQRYADGNAEDAVPPVYEYPHDGRCSVTGGYVYRGSDIDGLAGAYLYGDYCDGVIRALALDGDDVGDEREFDAQVPELVSFGEDARGELYALSLSGPVYRLTTAD